MKRNKLNQIKIIVFILLAFLLFFIESISTVNASNDEIVVEIETEPRQIIEELNIYEIKQKEFLHKEKEILSIQDHKEYYLEYKKLVEEYSEWIDQPKSIYDCHTEEEITLLHKVVEAEATAGEFDEKLNVACVIFNRIKHEKFGETLKEILTKHQFSPLADGRAYEVEITEDTILACEYAFQMPDVTGGAIYFESKDCNVHAAYSEFLFQDDIGHKFYKEVTTDGE